MALSKRIIRAYAAVRSYQKRRKRFDDDDQPPPPIPPGESLFTDEFTYEFEGRPNPFA
jgi:hypothetical protein